MLRRARRRRRVDDHAVRDVVVRQMLPESSQVSGHGSLGAAQGVAPLFGVEARVAQDHPGAGGDPGTGEPGQRRPA